MQAEISGAPTRAGRGSSSGSWLVTLKALETLEEAGGSRAQRRRRATSELESSFQDYSRYFVSACDPALDGICVAGK